MHNKNFAIIAIIILSYLAALCGFGVADENVTPAVWQQLLQTESFDRLWKPSEFGGEGNVTFGDGVVSMTSGQPMTGITYQAKDFPNDNYELKWQAQRTSGSDFFVCMTFPVDEQFCSVVVGGWGGGLVGISSINGNDASENATTKFCDFKNNQWYEFNLKVTPAKIEFSIDGEQLIDLERDGQRFSTRLEVGRSEPLGWACYQSSAELKSLTYRSLDAAGEQKVAPEFFRISNDADGEPTALQTAIASYRIDEGKFAGAEIDLIGAVHVGEVEYYKQLDKKFKQYDALLFELVADPNIRLAGRKDRQGVINPISSLQVAMKDALELQFQLEEINYEAKNFVHADMSPTEFMSDMEKRNDNFVNMFARVLGASIAVQSSGGGGDEAAILAAMLQPNRAMALRRVFAKQFQKAEIQMASLADKDGLSTLVTERNNKAFKVLRSELESGKRKIGIFYGAAHLEDMNEKLVRDFAATLGNVEWLIAWHLQ